MRKVENESVDAVVKRAIELLGGREKAWESFDKEHALILRRWDQDTETIGRILRAHLFVERFLTEYLQAMNPALGSLDDARLSFAQKTSLICQPSVSYLIPGIRHLNAIRNRLGHSLHAEITSEDARKFLQIRLFNAMRNEGAKRSNAPPRTDPVDVLEDFAKHAGMILHAGYAETGKAFRQAFEQVPICDGPD